MRLLFVNHVDFSIVIMRFGLVQSFHERDDLRLGRTVNFGLTSGLELEEVEEKESANEQRLLRWT